MAGVKGIERKWERWGLGSSPGGHPLRAVAAVSSRLLF